MELKILQLLLFLCMNLLVSGVGAAAQVRCIERERQALLKFKESLTGDLSGLTWGSEEDKEECCNWYGVECSVTGHVIRLDLSDKHLRGTISPALQELQHLKYLSLTNNNMTIDNLNWLSDVPLLSYLDLSGINLRNVTNWIQPITKLSLLEKLYLSGCQLHDNLPAFDFFANSSSSCLSDLYLSDNNLTSFSTLESLFNFSRILSHLDLSYNQLDGPVPGTLFKLHFLEELNLEGNLLHGGVHKPLENLSHLHSLDISFNKLNLPLAHLFQNLSEIMSLQCIYLSNNQLVGPLPDITRFSSLKELYLGNNHLDGLHPQSFNQASSLEVLDLSYNQLVGFLPDITRFSSLKELFLGNNQLDGVQPQSFNQASSLEFLDLSYNQLVGSLPDITRFSSLKKLYLSNNHLDGLHPQSLHQPSSLESLDLSGNQLKRLPEAIEHLLNLKYLNLSSTSLEGTITEHHLSNLTQLTKLDLSSNNVSFSFSFDWIPPFQLQIRLSHCNMGPYFPNWIRTQNSLSELYLSFAGISDTLPNWLWSMTSIQLLDLSHNNIRGRISDLALKLNHYGHLDLSHNNLSGPIPISVFQYSTTVGIETLVLSDNQLDGELPDCWMNLHDLSVLNLANNKFTGKLPPTLSTLKRLTILHLGNNNFTGELPSSWKNCTQLRKLDVGRNKLTGTIPAWIGTHLTNLAVLSLRFNSLHGSIPPTICYLTDIHVLDLSRNNISGKIPQCINNFTSLVLNDGSTILEYNPFLYDYGRPRDDDDNALVLWKGQEFEYERLRTLKGIDLSSNKLVGTIPQAFCDLRGLVFINLSRNQLTGNIISCIGQLDTLEWLDLSRNKLSGEIPNGLANLHFLSVLDLSYNNLTGKIPLSTQLQSFDSSVYAGNNQLCGDPLVECPRDPSVTHNGKVNVVEEDDRFINRDFYICMAFGFIIGFWVVVGTLILKHSWRHSYFKFWNSVRDWMYVTTTIYVTGFKRKFMS
ncbi:LRR receptor-like serine/threonine-protein kinase GSO2 [Olea europaea var. sylvestris]|uniref:LRR receptor-like serine/threonine-protein kinase GSO2 n=1 Tax=Olea europaea var. sylvestris TaxID=158386 RepID=UPI000C1D41F2|nr:LRR receptor-like serine/threonine-protein kinase GSO2 [Olea europaea var. sylvestris]